LYHTAFLTSQKALLEKRRIVKPPVRGRGERDDQFMRFKDAETYQVQVDFIEKLSGLNFTEAKENFKRSTPEKLIQ
jgi:endonuclease G